MGFIGRSVLTTVVVLVLSVTSAYSQQSPGVYIEFHGVGMESCGEYVVAYDNYKPYINTAKSGVTTSREVAQYWEYQNWINGFLAGVTAGSQRPIRSYDNVGMGLWIYNYCQQHPMDHIFTAAGSLWKELGGSQAP
jgi:hypothetical protein